MGVVAGEGYMMFPDYSSDYTFLGAKNGPEADKLLKREYREAYVVPEQV